jgi:predicted RNA binding protein YcfA (HicA-like mRNA interferase family)
MSRLPQLKPEQVVRALLKLGYFAREGARHTIIHNGREILTTVPRGSKTVKPGTLHGILKDVGLDPDEFKKLL